ncbi:MAG: glycosyltransferase [Clostridia bacterium]|nr:glycosyltransferase [Clostridia bacterium]
MEENNSYKVTLTIPVYNAGKYLRDLLESILKQTMDYREIEVIMVDDLSTDNSREIMDEYANKYSNFISVKLQENHKIAGTARNKGMEIAHGKYLMFADADDFLPENAVQTMYNAIESKNADFITANYINADEDGTLWTKPIFDLQKYTDFKLRITDYTKSFFVLNGSACNKIFRKEFIQSHNIKFLEGVPGEDAYFTTYSFMESENVYYIQDIVYCYRQRNQSNDLKSVSFYCSADYFERINRSYRAIYENFKAHNQLKFYRYMYAKNMSYIMYKFIDSTLLSDEERIQTLMNMHWFYELSEELKVPAAQEAQQMIISQIVKGNYEEAVNYCKIIADIRTYVPKQVREDMSRPDADMYQKIAQYDSEY